LGRACNSLDDGFWAAALAERVEVITYRGILFSGRLIATVCTRELYRYGAVPGVLRRDDFVAYRSAASAAHWGALDITGIPACHTSGLADRKELPDLAPHRRIRAPWGILSLWNHACQ